MTARTHSEIGKSNVNKGKDRERRVARYLRTQGWPFAERRQRTGFRTADRTRPDQGDLTGTPGIVWQIKDVAQQSVATWLEQTDKQRFAAGAEFGVLVVRRSGKADPGRWWAWVPAASLFQALTADAHPNLRCPICMELRDLAPLLFTAVGDRADTYEALPAQDLTPIRSGQVWSIEDQRGSGQRRYLRIEDVDSDINVPHLNGPKVSAINIHTGRRSHPRGSSLRASYRLETDVQEPVA